MIKDIDIYDVWIQQQNYNDDIKLSQNRTNAAWMQNYILGTVSELGELLEEIHWKQHRVADANEFGFNAVEELADITKYVISMWQVLNYTPDEMLQQVYEKGKILKQLREQEKRPAPTNKNILMLDLDGCIADFRQGFSKWLPTSAWKDKLTLGPEDYGLHLDLSNGWDFSSYNQAKIAFEAEGGYYGLPPISEVVNSISKLHFEGWYIIVYTARPFTQYKRIWRDTWKWLQDYDIRAKELHFGYDHRIEKAQKFCIDNNVVAIEDDPILIERYLTSNIPVCMIPQPYNQNLRDHPLLHKVYYQDPDWTIVKFIKILKELGVKNHVRS